MYNSILDGCAKQHRVDDALKLLDEMKATGARGVLLRLVAIICMIGACQCALMEQMSPDGATSCFAEGGGMLLLQAFFLLDYNLGGPVFQDLGPHRLLSCCSRAICGDLLPL